MNHIQVRTKERVYQVTVGENILPSLANELKSTLPDCKKLFFIVDSSVFNLHFEKVKKVIEYAFEYEYIVVPSGEKSKSFASYETCITAALKAKLNRKSAIISFGGGMVGDLGGFVAATFMRGIPFVQLPTTLLAHDSSVGGKVAINHPLGKNMIGCFYQPSLVFYELNFLRTLPDKEWRSGYAELLKHAYLSDAKFVEQLYQEMTGIEALKNNSNLSNYIKQGIEVKKCVVEEDEKESGLRACLNLGHTLAHALETIEDYTGIAHGEAVGIGLLFIIEESIKYGLQGVSTERLYKHLLDLGYSYNRQKMSGKVLSEIMLGDKKNETEKIRLVLLTEIGKPYCKEFSRDEVSEMVDTFIAKYQF